MLKTVLVVDDSRTTRRLVGLYLKSEGYALVQAENGLEALEKLAQGPVDLIITNMNMPRMDGVTLTRSLKQDKALRSIPVVMLTTEAGEQERQSGLAAGVSAYLIKPVAQARLAQEVRRVLAESSA